MNVSGYRDYRGVTVVGAWLWSDELGIGLATEIDLDEALAPYRALRNLVVGVLGVTVLLALGLTGLVIPQNADAAWGAKDKFLPGSFTELAEAAGTPVLIGHEHALQTRETVGSTLAGWASFQPLYDVIAAEQPDFLD